MERCLLERISSSFQNMVLGRESVPLRWDMASRAGRHLRSDKGQRGWPDSLRPWAGRVLMGRLVHLTGFLKIA